MGVDTGLNLNKLIYAQEAIKEDPNENMVEIKGNNLAQEKLNQDQHDIIIKTSEQKNS